MQIYYRHLSWHEVYHELTRDILASLPQKSVIDPEFTLREFSTFLDPDYDWNMFIGQLGLELPKGWETAFTENNTLKELCQGLANQTRIPLIQPARLLGCECQTAGAFFTLRAMIEEQGGKVDRITPSTPVYPLFRRHERIFHRLRLGCPRTGTWMISFWPAMICVISFIAAIVALLDFQLSLVGLFTLIFSISWLCMKYGYGVNLYWAETTRRQKVITVRYLIKALHPPREQRIER